LPLRCLCGALPLRCLCGVLPLRCPCGVLPLRCLCVASAVCCLYVARQTLDKDGFPPVCAAAYSGRHELLSLMLARSHRPHRPSNPYAADCDSPVLNHPTAPEASQGVGGGC